MTVLKTLKASMLVIARSVNNHSHYFDSPHRAMSIFFRIGAVCHFVFDVLVAGGHVRKCPFMYYMPP